MREFIQALGAPLNAAPVQHLLERFRLVEDASNPGHWESPSLGIALYLDDRGAVNTVFLFGNGKDDFREYRGSLPGDLTFRHGRTDVRRVCGEPTRSADPTTVAEGGYQHGGWDRYGLPTTSCTSHTSATWASLNSSLSWVPANKPLQSDGRVGRCAPLGAPAAERQYRWADKRNASWKR
jgi:hypothetical protein